MTPAMRKSRAGKEAAECKTFISALRTIIDKKAEVDAAEATQEQDNQQYEDDYKYLLNTIAEGNENEAMSYARYPESLAAVLKGRPDANVDPNSGDGKTDPYLVRAQEIATAYITLVKDADNIKALELELKRLIDDTDGVRNADNAEQQYKDALDEYDELQRELDSFDRGTETLKKTPSGRHRR